MCFLVGCQTGAQKQASQQQSELTKTENQVAQFGLSKAGTPIATAGTATNQGLGAITSAQSWFSKLLSGDKTSLMQAVAPAIQTLTGQYGQIAKNAKNTLPSGGERDKFLSELPLKQASDTATLIGGAQKEGATGLLDIAGLLGNFASVSGSLGTGLLGSSTSAAGTGGAIAANTYEQQLAQQQQQQQAGQGIGGLIALLAGI